MKNFIKNIILASFLVVVFSVISLPTFAADKKTVQFTPEIGFGGEFTAGKTVNIESDTIGKFLISTYKYGLGLIGVVATVSMMIAGFLWMTAAGDSSKINQAKSMISNSIVGLVVALCAYIILATVNTSLVEMHNLEISEVKSTAGPCSGQADGSIVFSDSHYWYCKNSTLNACKNNGVSCTENYECCASSNKSCRYDASADLSDSGDGIYLCQ